MEKERAPEIAAAEDVPESKFAREGLRKSPNLSEMDVPPATHQERAAASDKGVALSA